MTVPPCPNDLTESAETTDAGGERSGMPRSQSERLIPVCRDFSNSYQELQEKYHEIIYSTAEKVLRNSQANQMKQLKTCLEKETSDVMRQLNVMRRNDVKSLSSVHRDRDELVRYVNYIMYDILILSTCLFVVFESHILARSVFSTINSLFFCSFRQNETRGGLINS